MTIYLVVKETARRGSLTLATNLESLQGLEFAGPGQGEGS